MFTTFFPFRYINSTSTRFDDIPTVSYNYDFKGQSKRYIAIAEKFSLNVYAVKFYLAEKKSCDRKFNILSGQNECAKVITTVAQIMIEISRKDDLASFVVVGAPLPDETHENTKRFQLYSRILRNLLSPVTFEQLDINDLSTYICLNRKVDKSNKSLILEEVIRNVKKLHERVAPVN